jgi:hypothetical protein
MKAETPQPKRSALLVRKILLTSGLAAMVGYIPVTNAETGNTDDSIETLQQQVEILMQRINRLEQDQVEQEKMMKQEMQSVQAKPPLPPGTFRIPATDTEIEVSGYVKADFIYDSETDLGDSFIASSIPTGDVDGDGHTRFHARQSRLRVKSNSELGNGSSIQTHIEGDFFGGGGNESFSNSTSFRLRHANASFSTGAGTLLVGQYWSNFGDFVAYPSTVDFFGPAGKVFARQAQVRYTWNNGLSIALENPETDGTGAAGRLDESRGGIGKDETPDLTLAWRGGNYELSGVVRNLSASGVTEAGLPVDVSETGWGVNLAGGWQLGSLNVSASTTFGEGVGDYIINGFANGLYINDDGSGEAIESLSYNLAAKYNWSDSASSLLAFGHFENDNPARSNGIDTLDTVHVNYMWAPWPSTTFGVEAIFGDLELADGSSGDATRYQFAVQRNF